MNPKSVAICSTVTPSSQLRATRTSSSRISPVRLGHNDILPADPSRASQLRCHLLVRPDRPVVPDPPSEPSGFDGPSLPDNLNAPFEDTAPAGSNGDPHLTSFDGHSFNFQAGGEFTLVRLDSGDLEVQAREEPLRWPDGHENITISVNTAVAIKAGTDRVGIYQHPDRPELRINGQVVAPREAQQLSGGVRIQPDQGGYQLVGPIAPRYGCCPPDHTD